MPMPHRKPDRCRTGRRGAEVCSIVNGRKVDAHLHEPILANEEAERALSEERTQRMLRLGLTVEQIARLYG